MPSNFTRRYRVYLTFLAVAFIFSSPQAGAQFQLEWDFSNVEATLEFFSAPKQRQSTERLLALAATRELVAHSKSLDSAASMEEYSKEVKSIVSSETLLHDFYGFKKIKDSASALAHFTTMIKRKEKDLMAQLSTELSFYLPPPKKISVTVHFVLGGFSDGFAPDDANLYVALQYFKGDMKGLYLLTKHELFHNLQVSLFHPDSSYLAKLPTSDQKIFLLCINVFKEGSASYVADPLGFQGQSYIAWFQNKYRKNLARITQNFSLFDLMAFRLFYDDQSELNELYPIGFSGGWDSPLYYVGYVLCQSLGKEELKEMLSRSPVDFFLRYINFYHQHPRVDLPRFSLSTEQIFNKIRSRNS